MPHYSSVCGVPNPLHRWFAWAHVTIASEYTENFEAFVVTSPRVQKKYGPWSPRRKCEETIQIMKSENRITKGINIDEPQSVQYILQMAADVLPRCPIRSD